MVWDCLDYGCIVATITAIFIGPKCIQKNLKYYGHTQSYPSLNSGCYCIHDVVNYINNFGRLTGRKHNHKYPELCENASNKH